MDDATPPKLRWQDLDGEQRYRAIELLRSGKVEVRQLCRTFGVSRQTLYRAAEAADRASVEALTPKRRGRKPQPRSQKQVQDLERQAKALQKDLERMSQKYEIAQALLDLQRQAERGQRLPGEKKTPRTGRAARTGRPGPTGTSATLAGGDDRPDAGSDASGAGPMGRAQGSKPRRK